MFHVFENWYRLFKGIIFENMFDILWIKYAGILFMTINMIGWFN